MSAAPVDSRKRARSRFLRHTPAVIGALILAVLVLTAVFADPIGRVSPVSLDLRSARSAPSALHPLGVDLVGRDVWSRLVHAAQVSLEVGIGAVAVYVAIGVVLGAIAGGYGQTVEALILRIADMVMSFPLLVFVLVVVALVGPSLQNVILVLGLLGWPPVARLVRGQFLSLRESDFVLAARALGASNERVIIRHILPNTVGIVLVAATFGVANAILIEASLSFLGMGVQPPTASWGNMLADAQSLPVLENMPWLWIPPGVMIFVTILAINFVGDGLRDALDPRMLG